MNGAKGAGHAVTGVLAGGMAVYNAAAWWYRRERHLAINAVVYLALTALEVKQVAKHRHGGNQCDKEDYC